MPSFTHAVEIPEPPEAVFPWLLEADRVPQWMSGVRAYGIQGDGVLRTGARIRQDLEIGGQGFDLEMELTRYEPPFAAQTRFGTNGIDILNDYRLDPSGTGTRLTQGLDAKPRSFAGRMIIPVVQPRLERKIREDLERLRSLLDGAA